jgi:hypothetical protein
VSASMWEAEGQRIGASVDPHHCVVLIGDDPDRAAEVALGVGRVQARRRRVAVVDLVGELSPLQRHVPADLAHGIVDTILHGVSLTKVAHAIDRARNLFILPSGAGLLDHAALLRDGTWRRLATDFRESDALLLVVAPSGTDGMEEFLAATEGAIVAVGSPRLPDGARVIEAVVGPRTTPRAQPADVPRAAPRAAPADGAPATRSGAAVNMPASPSAPLTAAPGPSWPAATSMVAPYGPASLPTRARRRTALWAAAATLLAAAAALWASERTRRVTTPAAGIVVAADTAVPTASLGTSSDTPSAVTVSGASEVDAAGAAPPVATLAESSVVAPDSAHVASYAIEITKLSRREDAATVLDRHSQGLPAATLSAVTLVRGRARWYSVLAGAYREPAQADSLLRVLRRQRVIDRAQGSVVRAPYALLVADRVVVGAVPATLTRYRAAGLPAYALLQDDGTARIYAGAFETPEQAGLLTASLPAQHRQLRVTYRTGRLF